MAITGVSKSFYAKYKETAEGSGVYEYTGGRAFAKMTSITHTPETNTSELYADNNLEEADYSFSKGSFSVDVSDLEDGVAADILGVTVEEDENGNSEYVYTAEDKTVETGFGFVIQKKINGIFKYRAIVLTRLVFKVPANSATTRQGTLTFQTEKIDGTTFTDRSPKHVWKRECTFSTEEEAVAYIKAKLNISDAAAANVEPEANSED